MLAMIFVVMRELRCFFRLNLLCFPLTRSSLSEFLKPSYVAFQGYKILPCVSQCVSTHNATDTFPDRHKITGL